jgi:hypothetical protein
MSIEIFASLGLAIMLEVEEQEKKESKKNAKILLVVCLQR